LPANAFAFTGTRGFALFAYLDLAREDMDKTPRSCHAGTLAGIIVET
jgi:hypothetical protein